MTSFGEFPACWNLLFSIAHFFWETNILKGNRVSACLLYLRTLEMCLERGRLGPHWSKVGPTHRNINVGPAHRVQLNLQPNFWSRKVQRGEWDVFNQKEYFCDCNLFSQSSFFLIYLCGEKQKDEAFDQSNCPSRHRWRRSGCQKQSDSHSSFPLQFTPAAGCWHLSSVSWVPHFNTKNVDGDHNKEKEEEERCPLFTQTCLCVLIENHSVHPKRKWMAVNWSLFWVYPSGYWWYCRHSHFYMASLFSLEVVVHLYRCLVWFGHQIAAPDDFRAAGGRNVSLRGLRQMRRSNSSPVDKDKLILFQLNELLSSCLFWVFYYSELMGVTWLSPRKCTFMLALTVVTYGSMLCK